MIRRPPRSTQGVSSAASDVYKRQGIGHDANEAFHYILEQIPTIAPLFRIIQRQHVHTPKRNNSSIKTAKEIVIPFFTDGAVQQILPELERFTPTAEDPTVKHRIETVTPPPLLMINIQRAGLDGRVCGRLITYGQRLELNGSTYIYCLLYTSPSPRDGLLSRMPSSA